MTVEALTAPKSAATDSIFDFSRNDTPAAAALPANEDAPLCADRRDPEPGWATRNPEKAMLFLFLTPREGIVADELFGL